MNMYWQALWFELPQLPAGLSWHIFANTSMISPEDSYEPGYEPRLDNQSACLLGDRSVVILVSK